MFTAGHPQQKRWTQAIGFSGPQLRIPYRLAGNLGSGLFFSAKEEDMIRFAMTMIRDELGGCIEFYDDTNTKLYHDKYIQIRLADNSCSSALGMVTESWVISNTEGGKYQDVNLASPGCLWPTVIQHELYHALGFGHEQNRGDRDEHIVMHWENIDAPHLYQKVGERWMDIGERYEFNSIMHYGGIVDREKGIYTMTRVDNGEPVEPKSNHRVSSIDVIQLHHMYKNFCPVRPETFPCDNGDYFLKTRSCDGVPDCLDNSDEGPKYCGAYHCGETITISSEMNQDFEGTFKFMDSYVNEMVAYQTDRHILSYDLALTAWTIKEISNSATLAWGKNYDGTCPQGADASWHIEPKTRYAGFSMESGINIFCLI